MNNLNRIFGTTLVLFLLLNVSAQDKKQLLDDFVSSDWQKVKAAKIQLENMQGSVIPDLIQLLDNKSKVKLENTGTLIYPGAERFYGHGQIIDYDIDYIAVRAGWLIEEISFNNFGFSGIHLPKVEMPDYIRITFPSYYNNSNNRKRIEMANAEELRNIVQNLAIKGVKDWWLADGPNFTRLESLDLALQSFDEKRQVRALFYIRNGTTKCDGLTKDYYYDELIKEIGRLSSSDIQRISENAKLILLDTKFDWLALKGQ